VFLLVPAQLCSQTNSCCVVVVVVVVDDDALMIDEEFQYTCTGKLCG